MGCACRRSKKEETVSLQAAVQSPNGVNGNMSKMINFEGKLIALNALPQGSIFVRGVWYSSVLKMPEDVRAIYEEKMNGRTNS